MTQKQLSEKVGVDVRWIQKIEGGEINLSNITFLNGIKLLLAFCDDDVELKEYKYCLETVYYMLEDTLANEQPVGS